MTTMTIIVPTIPLTTLKITGPDAATFLHGLTTCDIKTLNNTPLLAACCNQKGRIITNFWIWCHHSNFYLRLPQTMQPLLQSHLQKYKLRSQVNFAVVELATNPIPDNVQPIWILPVTSQQFTPQMIDLQHHGEVSLTKGCYLGQEIIARTAHLGQLKRHLYRITLQPSTPTHTTIQVGDVIYNDAKQPMGTVVAIYAGDGGEPVISAVIEDRAVTDRLATGSDKLQHITRALNKPLVS